MVTKLERYDKIIKNPLGEQNYTSSKIYSVEGRQTIKLGSRGDVYLKYL